jgi:Xaa-Pro aminopeptidase
MGRSFLCDAFPYFSDEEYQNRFKRVREKMAEHGIDALLIHGSGNVGNSVGQVNLSWLAGYAWSTESFMVFPYEGEPTITLAVPIQIENALKISYVQDIRSFSNSGPSLLKAFERLKELKVEKGRIGLVGPGNVSRAGYTLYKEQYDLLVQEFPNAEIVNATTWFDDLRLIKSEEELNVLREAARVNDLAYHELVQTTRPGREERDLLRAVYGVAARHGATYPFISIVARDSINPPSFNAGFYPTNNVIKEHNLIQAELTLGYGTTYSNKMWPQFFVGEPHKDFIRLHEVAAKVYRDLVAGLKVGMKGREINKFLQPIADAGFEQAGNAVVGGWSNQMHAPFMGVLPGSWGEPFAEADLDKTLEKGMTLTLHIWVKVPNTQKAYWMGSSGAMTDKGFENFNKFPVDELIIL